MNNSNKEINNSSFSKKGFNNKKQEFSAHVSSKSIEALELVRQGKLQEAEKLYQELIRNGIRDHLVYENLAILCAIKGDTSEMIELLNKAIKINPNHTEAYMKLGITLQSKNYFKAAIPLFQKAIIVRPNNPEAYNNLGIAFQREKNLTKAISSYQQAIKIKPNYPEAYNNLGVAFRQLGKVSHAIDSYKRATELRPGYSEAHNNLGVALYQQDNLTDAITSLKQAIKLNPSYPEAYNNLANSLKSKGDLNEAITSFQQAIRLRPNYPEAYNNLGVTLKENGRIADAIKSFQRAIELRPGYVDAHWNLSLVQLLSGDYLSGWINYNWRWKQNNIILHASPIIQKWDEPSFRRNCKLLVIAEQGLGDTIQYMRYIPHLQHQKIDILFCAQQKLHSLIKSSGINDNPLTPEQGNMVTEGRWIPLLSLPKYLGVTAQNPIVNSPYIFSTENLIDKWRKILSNEKKPIIGINWQGNPKMEQIHRGRSIPLEVFSKLHEQNKITLLSLQKGFGTNQLNKCTFRESFVKSQNFIDNTLDFVENAAIIYNCDLIITCDTAVAHLAGGMGKKVWLLLRHIPFWTWGMHSEKTFWYPSMRLFRQNERDNWEEVMERVSIELKKYFKGSN